uniref:Uncharacterized protein n=1 Tax=Amphiprion percula TaxID=161767 RepID=A0A3P8UCG5_AMPPE
MPVNEQRKLQYREFLQRFGALSRTPDTEPSPDPTETQHGCSNTHSVALPSFHLSSLFSQSAPQCSSRRPASVGRPETGNPLGTMERRLRGAVQHCWKEIQRKCTELDPQREGHISTALNIKMTEDQFKHLAGKLDIMNNGHVSYHSFLRHFLLNLKPAESMRTFERRRLPLPTKQLATWLGMMSPKSPHNTPEYTQLHTHTCSNFCCFALQVLRHFSVNLSEEEFFHISSYFDANTTGKICYNSFLWMFLH